MSRAGHIYILAVFAGCVNVSWAAPAPVWNGDGTDNNWSNPLNWTSEVAPANNGTANISFAGQNRLTSAVDLPWDIASLGFKTGAGAFTITQLPLSIGAGGIVNNSANAQTINTDITLTAGQTWNAAAGPLFYTRAIDNNRSTLTVDGGFDTTINSTITNRGGLVKNGVGNLALGSGSFDFFANTHTGTTTVNAGTLWLNKAAGTVAIPGDLIVNGAPFTVGGSVVATAGGQISASSNVTLNGGNISFGDSNTIGSFTGNGNGYFTATGQTLILTSTAPYALTLVQNGNEPVGFFKLTSASGGGVFVGYSGFLTASTPGLDIGAVDRVINTQGDFIIGGPGILSGGGGILKTGPATLYLGDGNTYAGGTTINEGRISIYSDAGLGIAGTALTLNGGLLQASSTFSLSHPITSNNGGIVVDAGATLTVVPAVQGPALTKLGGGKLTLSANTFNDSLTINQGTVVMAGTTTLHFNTLDIAGSAGNWSGVLDLRKSSLVLEGGDLGVITDQIRSGIYNGTGILSGAHGTAYRLGSMSNDNGAGGAIYESFQGIDKLNGNQVLIRFTLIGDLNLDGAVSISDFIDLAAHFNTIGGATWQMGDVNYDGSITISDFIDLSSNFGQSVSGIATPISEEDQKMLSGFAASNVPEPAVLELISVALLIVSGRRYSRSCM